MKVNMSFPFDDEKRRKVRKALGFRGGKATRQECRIFIDRATYNALKIIEPPPAPRPRAPKINPHAEAEQIVNDVLTQVCTCGATYHEHKASKGRLLCPVSKRNPPASGRVFTAAEGAK